MPLEGDSGSDDSIAGRPAFSFELSKLDDGLFSPLFAGRDMAGNAGVILER